PNFRINYDVYRGTTDFLLNYMRQQRCGYNPFLKDSCHTRDGYIIYHPALDSAFIDVVGGWHDASDYLQYVTTSANAVFQMLFAYQQNPKAFGDRFNAAGLPGSNGIPDVLDEAKWGLDWLVKMNPSKDLMFNQVADDRDHLGFRLPTQDTVNYGRGKERPVYFATGQPQGIGKYKNRSTGLASTAGKFASAFALGSQVLRPFSTEFSELIKKKSKDAFEIGVAHPGVCQTAPCRAPYFYEEDNWLDDLELAAVQVASAFDDTSYLAYAIYFGNGEGGSPWMGADTAHHYQWYPFVNLGHYMLAKSSNRKTSDEFRFYLRESLDRLFERGKSNAFLSGIPFIWCSNNYVAAALTQIRLYEQVTRDTSYREMEASLRDWLFGCNPWGTSMIVGLPKYGVSPKDPHSAFTHLYGYEINGGLVDGPVRGSIFNSLKGIHLSKPDAFSEFQSDVAVYHDDWGDYSTNEPTMDGTASLTYYLSSLEVEGGLPNRNNEVVFGGITRMNTAKKEIYVVFTGHEFADGGETIRRTLKKHNIKASLFFTGDFYRNKNFAPLIKSLMKDGHYLGGHSDKHLLYASWEKRDSLLVTRDSFLIDIRANYEAMKKFGLARQSARYYLPPYEWYNQAVSEWCNELGLTLVNFTPGTSSNADYTTPDMANYLSSDSIYQRILRYESTHANGLNGFILLTHIGTSPMRTDRFYRKLDGLIRALKKKGYRFESL
ncbi:MAG: glycoside hydrolase family 9 protein, partial [Bacteroidota bacterium]